MDLSEIDKEFQVLADAIEENKHREEKNLWEMIYHMWKFYYLLNQKIAVAEDLKGQVAVVDKYISLFKGKPPIEAVGPKPQGDVGFEPHLQEILHIYEKESALFSKNLRRIKAQKKKTHAPKKSKPAKSKWVKS